MFESIPWLTDTVIAAAITGGFGYLVARLSAQRQLRAPYQQLASRVSRLEHEVGQLMSREHLWQAGWDRLRSGWDTWRKDPRPPEYPTPKLKDTHEPA